MGGLHGGNDIITGRIVGSTKPEETYDEWLFRLLVEYGDGKLPEELNNFFVQMALTLGHLEHTYEKTKVVFNEGHIISTRQWNNITPKGKKYIQTIDLE